MKKIGSYMPQKVEHSDQKPQGITKAPEGLSAPLYGVLGGNPLAAMPSLHFATSVTAAPSPCSTARVSIPTSSATSRKRGRPPGRGPSFR